jgi:predicted small secreted protein
MKEYKMKLNFKITAVVLAVVTALAGCSTVGLDGKEHASTGNSAMAGVGIGAVLGALVAGQKGALIGAALGGSLGFVAGLENQKQELAAAKLAAVEIESVTKDSLKLKPVVYSQNYQDVKTGEKVEGLKFIDVPLPIAQMTDKKSGLLTEKGIEAIVKLQAVADKTGGGIMEIVVPETLSARTFASLSKAAPKAKITVADQKNATARIGAKPVNEAGNVKVMV